MAKLSAKKSTMLELYKKLSESEKKLLKEALPKYDFERKEFLTGSTDMTDMTGRELSRLFTKADGAIGGGYIQIRKNGNYARRSLYLKKDKFKIIQDDTGSDVLVLVSDIVKE